MTSLHLPGNRIAAAVLLLGASIASAASYTFTDLGVAGHTPGNPDNNAVAINNAGVVAWFAQNVTAASHVKVTYLCTPKQLVSHGFTTNDACELAKFGYSVEITGRASKPIGTASLKPGAAFTFSQAAYAINPSGLIAGYANIAADAAPHADSNGATPPLSQAITWDGVTSTYLDTLRGTSSRAYAINDKGVVAGYAYTTDNARHAAVWIGTKLTDLGMLEGDASSVALGINNHGKVAGYSYAHGNTVQRAAIWDISTSPPTVTELGKPGGHFSRAYAINDDGVVAGFANTGGNQQHATVWQDNVTIDLGTLGGTSSLANAINKDGVVVGYANIIEHYAPHDVHHDYPYDVPSNVSHATVWSFMDSTSARDAAPHSPELTYVATDLNCFLDAKRVEAGWVLVQATGINDSGSIVGYAVNSKTSAQHAFLLTVSESTVPESACKLKPAQFSQNDNAGIHFH